MSSSPSRPHLLEVTIKRVPGGLVSNWFCEQVKLGDVLTVKGPSGKFTCFNYPSSKMLFIGAGSGITPVVSMCRWIADTASDVDVKLLASFKSPTDIIFRKEFELWAARGRRFQVAITLTSGWDGTDYWTGYRGRISEQMLNVFVPDLHDRHVFMCGPEPFADGVKKILQDLGFNMANFHTESFGSGRSAQGSKGGGSTQSSAGAELLCGGRREGAMLEATLLENVPIDQSVCTHEAFGPVAVLSKFRDFDAALDEVNRSVFGLQAGIFTRDIYKAHRAWDKLEVGGVIIGDVPSWRVDHMPYGGVKDSGLGREGVRFAMEDMTEIRLMVLRFRE